MHPLRITWCFYVFPASGNVTHIHFIYVYH